MGRQDRREKEKERDLLGPQGMPREPSENETWCEVTQKSPCYLEDKCNAQFHRKKPLPVSISESAEWSTNVLT